MIGNGNKEMNRSEKGTHLQRDKERIVDWAMRVLVLLTNSMEPNICIGANEYNERRKRNISNVNNMLGSVSIWNWNEWKSMTEYQMYYQFDILSFRYRFVHPF